MTFTIPISSDLVKQNLEEVIEVNWCPLYPEQEGKGAIQVNRQIHLDGKPIGEVKRHWFIVPRPEVEQP